MIESADNVQYREIFDELHCKLLDEGQFREVLTREARRFGILEHECSDAADRMLTMLSNKAASLVNRRVTAAELEGELAGFRCPRRLRARNVLRAMLRHIGEEAEHVGVPVDEKTLLRANLVHNPVFSRRALVIIWGPGGTGKTVTAFQVLRRRIATSEEPPPPFVASARAEELRSAWVAETVSGWRNSPKPDHRQESIDTAIDRLLVASPSDGPVLLLTLDGVDELRTAADHHAVLSLIRWFHRCDQECLAARTLPRAVLIVTCRDRNEVSEWIATGGFSAPVDEETLLRVDRFASAEICELARRTVETSVADRIELTASRIEDSDWNVSFLTSPSSWLAQQGASEVRFVRSAEGAVRDRAARFDLGESREPARPQVCEALRDPSLWRCFVDLGDERIHHAVLDGEPEALKKLSALYIKWVCWKAENRRYSVHRDMARLVLRSVAIGFAEPWRTGSRVVHWIQPACSLAGCSPTDAIQMFKESESIGLIERVDEDHWKWRHTFVCEYLADSQI